MKEKTQNAGRGASLAMGVAFVGFTTQFGLIPLVKTGYSYIGYATLIVIVIPFIVHMIVGCVKKQPVMGSEAAENKKTDTCFAGMKMSAERIES